MQTYRLMWGGVLMAAVVAWMGWGTPQALAQQARVPLTGQTTCLDAAGSPINCTGMGQDGAIQAGVPSPNPRFSDTKDGTFNPALPSGHPFSGVQPAVYWSSTTIADDPGLAWGVSLVVGSPRPVGKADTGRVWLVRGGD